MTLLPYIPIHFSKVSEHFHLMLAPAGVLDAQELWASISNFNTEIKLLTDYKINRSAMLQSFSFILFPLCSTLLSLA